MRKEAAAVLGAIFLVVALYLTDRESSRPIIEAEVEILENSAGPAHAVSPQTPESGEASAAIGTEVSVVEPTSAGAAEAVRRFPVIPGAPYVVSHPQCMRLPGDGQCFDVMTGARKLAEETDDPQWARPMEGRIFEAFNQFLIEQQLSVSSIDVVCREASCGILVLDPRFTDSAFKPFANGFRDEFEFRLATYASGSNTSRYTAIYFWDARR